jgi:hypothetical protein
MRWHQTAKPGRVFSMMVAALPFVGQDERRTAFQYPNRLVLTLGETANLLTTSLTPDLFGVKDSSPGGRLF